LKISGSHAYSIEGDVEKIKQEIMTNGPVEGAFTVYQDFLQYKSGTVIYIIIWLHICMYSCHKFCYKDFLTSKENETKHPLLEPNNLLWLVLSFYL
jgi:hypothetical protein